MASTAGEGTSYEGSGGGGGAGGKFRKKPFRRPQMTPYDRPQALALRNPRSNGWLSKLVDPASKLISASAHLFFSSVFRKRLTPPPPLPPPEANRESRDGFPEAVLDNPPGVQIPVVNDGGKPTDSCNSSELSELEQILKQKTFTRSEFDRLTELLHSRTVDLPHGDEDKRTELNFPQPISAAGRRHEFTSHPMQENGIESHLDSHKLLGCVSTPVISSQVLEEDVAAPSELAKAYMGSRPSKVPPSMFGLHGQALKEDASVPNDVQFTPKSSAMSLVPKPAVHVRVHENGFITPRSRGRSAIYSMARTPYSRGHSTAAQKGTGSTYDGYGGPFSSSSQFVWEHDGQYSSKQSALKRRSSVLEDNFGSVGPIRRLRQKTNLSTPNNLRSHASGSPLSSRGTGVGPDAVQYRMSSTQKLPSLDDSKHRMSKTAGENEDTSIPGTSYTPVPSKSTEMATKILQQLDKLVPKEKSSEGKVVAAREKSTNKLTPRMLSGQALRILEDEDSSNILRNGIDTHKLKDMRNGSLFDAGDTSSQKQDKVENGPKKLVISSDTLAPAVISNGTVSKQKAVPGFKNADSVSTQFLAQPSKNKWGFQMSAHEDFVELDDEIHSNNAASTLKAEGKKKLETFMVESKSLSSEAVTVEKTSAVSEFKTLASPVLERSTDLEASNGTVVGEGKTGLTFPITPASSTTFQLVVASPQSTSALDKTVPPREPIAPLFGFGSKNVDGIPSPTFSYSTAVSDSSVLKSIAPLEPKPDNPNSLANVASGAIDTVPKISESNKADNKNMQNSGEIIRKSEASISSALSTSTSTSNTFSSIAPAKSSSLTNGALGSSPFSFSSPSPVLASSNFSNQAFANSFTNVASFTAALTSSGTTLNTSQSTSAATPSLPAAPIFKFGSIAPTTSVSTVSTISSAETTDLNAKTEKETNFGNLTNSPFGVTSFAMASTGSSIFGFSASATSSTTNNLSQGSPFGFNSGLLTSKQASPAGIGVATATQSIPVQFGQSAPSGTTGIISFTSSSSPFGSSTSTAPVFGSSTSGFGLSSSASLSETNSISSGAATSSPFGSTWQQPPKSSIFNSNTASPGFSFSPAASSQTQPVFDSPVPLFTATASGNNSDQMSMEDSMAEDHPIQASTPTTIPVFGQNPISTPISGFGFGPTASLVGNPFQFSGQQNQSTLQNPPPFQATGSLDFNAGGSSFSLGSGGGEDKSNRRIVKVKHKNRRR